MGTARAAFTGLAEGQIIRNTLMSDRYDIVLLNMSRYADWQSGVINRNYYLARELAASPHVDKVLMIDLLPHTFRRAVRIWWQDIRAGNAGETVLEAHPHWRLSQREPNRLFHLSTVEPILSEQRFLATLQSVLHKLGFRNSILWSYLPTYPHIFGLPHWSARVFDAVDDWTAHPSYAGIAKRLSKNYQYITEHADCIFTVSQELKGKFARNRSVHWVPNGVDLARFQSTVPDPYPANGRPRIVYVGVLQRRFNAELLAELAAQRPHYDFYLIGPVWPDAGVEALRPLRNIHLLGFVPADRTPAYLVHAQVGIVPHRPDALVASMNPMKIYEYLAAGIPVVSTPIADFSAYAGGVTFATTAEAFCAGLDDRIQHPPTKEALRELVRSDAWSSRFARMWNMVLEGIRESSRPSED